MATIRKRVNETTIKYQARVRVSNHPTITKTFNLRSHAIQWAREREIQIEKGDLNSGYKPTKETLGDALERYLKEITPGKKSSDREENKIRNLMRDPIASIQFSNLRPEPTRYNICNNVFEFYCCHNYPLIIFSLPYD